MIYSRPCRILSVSAGSTACLPCRLTGNTGSAVLILNSVRLQTLNGNQTRTGSLDTLVTIIDQRGKNMAVQNIRVYMDNGMVPLCSELVLKVNNDLHNIGQRKYYKHQVPGQT